MEPQRVAFRLSWNLYTKFGARSQDRRRRGQCDSYCGRIISKSTCLMPSPSTPFHVSRRSHDPQQVSKKQCAGFVRHCNGSSNIRSLPSITTISGTTTGAMAFSKSSGLRILCFKRIDAAHLHPQHPSREELLSFPGSVTTKDWSYSGYIWQSL